MSPNNLNLRWKGFIILSLWLIQVLQIPEGASASNEDKVKTVSGAARPYRAKFTFVVRDYRTLNEYVVTEKNHSTLGLSTESEPELKWNISLGYYNSNNLTLDLSVDSLPSAVDKLSGYAECGLIDTKGEKRYFEGKMGSTSKHQTFQHYQIITLDELKSKAEELLPDEQLTTQCEIKGVLHSDGKDPSEMKTELIRKKVNLRSECSKKIARDTLDKLRVFEDDIPSDIEFKSSDKRFKCHSILVYARMPLFDLTSTDADPEGVVVYNLTEDVNPEELEDMVSFMYRGKAPNLDKTCRVLYGVARKYGFHCLKSSCEEVMMGQVKETNAKEYFKIAQEIWSTRLEKKAADVIYKI